MSDRAAVEQPVVPDRTRRNRGFVLERGGGFRIDRRRKLSSLVSNEIILAELHALLAREFSDRRNGSMLDLGAGLKPYAVVYEPYFSTCVSVDHPHSQHAIEVDILASADALPIEDASFDFVLCTEVLEHCPDPAAVLAEIRRVLRPGGVVLLTTPFMVALHEMPFDFYRYTPSALELMAGNARLELESIVTRGDYLAVAMSFFQFPITKAWQALSRILRMRLSSPWNPFLFVFVVLPQLLYLAYWRRARRAPGGLARRIYRKLDYVTLGYVSVLRRGERP